MKEVLLEPSTSGNHGAGEGHLQGHPGPLLVQKSGPHQPHRKGPEERNPTPIFSLTFPSPVDKGIQNIPDDKTNSIKSINRVSECKVEKQGWICKEQNENTQ